MVATLTLWITALGLAYIVSPIDLLPELILGPIGLTDDALVAVAILFTWISDLGFTFFIDYFQTNPINAALLVTGVMLLVIGVSRYARPKSKLNFAKSLPGNDKFFVRIK